MQRTGELPDLEAKKEEEEEKQAKTVELVSQKGSVI